jgi:hypothetical protein
MEVDRTVIAVRWILSRKIDFFSVDVVEVVN